MHQVSDVRLQRRGTQTAVVTATLHSPELNYALGGTGLMVVFVAWGTITIGLCWFAWEGGIGDTAHAFVRLCIASAGVMWVAYNANRIWQEVNRTTLHQLIVACDAEQITVDGPDGGYRLSRSDEEIRFSSRPHRGSVQEERDERRVGHPIGYAYRDGWEVWCEAGLDVRLVVAVSNEFDARAIVRHLTEAQSIGLARRRCSRVWPGKSGASMMGDRKPSSGMFYFLAILMWVISWWLLDLIDDEPVGTAVAVFLSFFGLCYALGAIGTAIPRASPFTSLAGRIAWALRPRSWLIAWLSIIVVVQVFGAPMVLWNYGGGRCQYVDWHLGRSLAWSARRRRIQRLPLPVEPVKTPLGVANTTTTDAVRDKVRRF